MQFTTPEGMGRHTIDADSTAVLAFDDGTRIPCDRFVMRFASSVLRDVLDATTCATDDRGRTVLPVPGRPSEPYWDVVDVLHGCAALTTMDVPRLLRLGECMDHLGAAALMPFVDARLWTLLQHAPLKDVLPHAPRFLRSKAHAASAVKRLIVHKPLWADFKHDVLAALPPDVASTIVHYAPNFFPPALVVAWALGKAADDPNPDDVCRLAYHHGVMYHPCEVVPVLQKVAAMLAADDPHAAKLLRMVVHASSKCDASARPSARCTAIMFTDTPMASVSLVLEARKPRRVRVTRWCSVALDTLDVRFVPARMDDAAAACTAMQIRVMVLDAPGVPAAHAEAWFLFRINNHFATHTLAQADETRGDPDALHDLLGIARQLRVDFFYGATCILDEPFDAARCHAFFS